MVWRRVTSGLVLSGNVWPVGIESCSGDLHPQGKGEAPLSQLLVRSFRRVSMSPKPPIPPGLCWQKGVFLELPNKATLSRPRSAGGGGARVFSKKLFGKYPQKQSPLYEDMNVAELEVWGPQVLHLFLGDADLH